MTEPLLLTPLFNCHKELGARMVPFGGWNMPVQYPDGIIAEHKHCRSEAALFDICHMGEFRIKGSTAEKDLDFILARTVTDQDIGSCRYNLLLNENGGILDDLIVYRLAEDEFYLVVNAGRRNSDAVTLQKYLNKSTVFIDETASTAKLDLQGPKAAEVLLEIGLKQEELPKYFRWERVNILGVDVLLSRTGYTGELGYELYFSAEKTEFLWKKLLENPKVKPAGLGARDTLRLEMGFALYGNELNTDINPLEAGFAFMIKLKEQRNFVGKDALVKIAENQVEKQLLGFMLESKRAARSVNNIIWQGEIVGTVSSGAFAPSVNTAVALGYVKSSLQLQEGDKIEIDTGRTKLPASVCKMPFYKEGTVRIKI